VDIIPQDKRYVQQFILICFEEGVYAVVDGADFACSAIDLDYPFSENTKLCFGKQEDTTSLMVGADIGPGNYIVMGVNTFHNIIFVDSHANGGFDQVDLDFGDKAMFTLREGQEISFSGAVYMTPVE
jgi:hypothetical protein